MLVVFEVLKAAVAQLIQVVEFAQLESHEDGGFFDREASFDLFAQGIGPQKMRNLEGVVEVVGILDFALSAIEAFEYTLKDIGVVVVGHQYLFRF